jgi:hypothetical protein
MIVDRHLNWKPQSEKFIKKLNTACFMLRKLQYVVSEQALRMVYFARYQSLLEYRIIFWGSSLAMKEIFVAQKRAIRVML